MKTFPAQLIAWRQHEQLSQAEAGARLGVTGQYIGMLERGEKEIVPDSTLARLLNMLDKPDALGANRLKEEHPAFRIQPDRPLPAAEQRQRRLELLLSRIRQEAEAMAAASDPAIRAEHAELAKLQITRFLAWLAGD